MTHDDRGQDFIFIKLKVVLLEDGHALAWGNHDVARGRLQLTGKHLEEGRLAGAVRADNAVAVSGGKLDIDVLEERLSAVRERYVLGCDHGFLVLLFEVVIFLVEYIPIRIIPQKCSSFKPFGEKIVKSSVLAPARRAWYTVHKESDRQEFI